MYTSGHFLLPSDYGVTFLMASPPPREALPRVESEDEGTTAIRREVALSFLFAVVFHFRVHEGAHRQQVAVFESSRASPETLGSTTRED
ncbi:hypothetical protein MRX96_055583 [Rhipicephalus microplus]